MEEIVLLLLILLLIFGFGSARIPPGFDFPEEPDVERDITGNQKVEFVEENDIYREFQGKIGGNSQVTIETKRGNIYLRFAEKIAGNPKVNIKTVHGDIFIRFEKTIEGNAEVNIESTYGNVTFANERSTIESFMGRNLNVRAGGRIHYRTGSLRDLIKLSTDIDGLYSSNIISVDLT